MTDPERQAFSADSDHFWTGESSYGAVHRAEQPADARGTLLVFVHGLYGDCRRTWRNMPAWVLQTAGAVSHEQQVSMTGKLTLQPGPQVVCGQRYTTTLHELGRVRKRDHIHVGTVSKILAEIALTLTDKSGES